MVKVISKNMNTENLSLMLLNMRYSFRFDDFAAPEKNNQVSLTGLPWRCGKRSKFTILGKKPFCQHKNNVVINYLLHSFLITAPACRCFLLSDH
jgi:hypothetical protein